METATLNVRTGIKMAQVAALSFRGEFPMTPLTPLGIQKLTVQMPDSLQGVGTGAELVTKPRPLGSRPGRSPRTERGPGGIALLL